MDLCTEKSVPFLILNKNDLIEACDNEFCENQYTRAIGIKRTKNKAFNSTLQKFKADYDAQPQAKS